jgi:hypothetical protein
MLAAFVEEGIRGQESGIRFEELGSRFRVWKFWTLPIGKPEPGSFALSKISVPEYPLPAPFLA